MPKLKSHRGAAKRFKLTATGKIVKNNACKRHILTKKSAKRKRRLNAPSLVSKGDTARVRRMLLVN